MKMAILYGLKKRVRQFPNEDPDAKVLGVFEVPDSAIEYVNAGGLPKEYPYYAVALEEGHFWVVDSAQEWTSGLGKREGARPALLAGPFENPTDAICAQIMVDQDHCGVQCISDKWAESYERKEISLRTLPPIEWAKSRIEKWARAIGVGESELALGETIAFMRVVREWAVEASGADDAYLEELVNVGNDLTAVHKILHERCNAHRAKAKHVKLSQKADQN